MPVAAVQKAKKTKKQRKHGRNSKGGQNARYKAESRREKSHVKRIARHLKRFPDDHCAASMLTTYKKKAGIYA